MEFKVSVCGRATLLVSERMRLTAVYCGQPQSCPLTPIGVRGQD